MFNGCYVFVLFAGIFKYCIIVVSLIFSLVVHSIEYTAFILPSIETEETRCLLN